MSVGGWLGGRREAVAKKDNFSRLTKQAEGVCRMPREMTVIAVAT